VTKAMLLFTDNIMFAQVGQDLNHDYPFHNLLYGTTQGNRAVIATVISHMRVLS